MYTNNPYRDTNKVIKDDSYRTYLIMIGIGLLSVTGIFVLGFYF